MAETDKKVLWPGWETVRLIGRGSFGSVYEIERDVFGHKEQAALKVLRIPQHESDIEELYDSGYDEAGVTATFKSHLESIVNEYSLMREMNGAANVVNCDDFLIVPHDDNIGYDIFIKMELLTSLTKALDKQPSEEQVIRIAKDMCTALILCRQYGIIHRDIKPQNIFVSKNGDYKLGDFGIAKTMERTTGGTKVGTYKYMAPEVYNNKPYNFTADIYSLGLVLHWLLNERRSPFMPLPPEPANASMEEKARLKRYKGVPIPAPAHGSEELKRIVLKACAFDPKDRYQNADEMLRDLKMLDQEKEFKKTPPLNSGRSFVQAGSEREEDGTQGGFFSSKASAEPEQKEKPVSGVSRKPAEVSNKPPAKTASTSREHDEEETVGAFNTGKKPEILQEKKGLKGKKWIIPAVAVLVLAVVLILVFAGKSDKASTGSNNGSSNTSVLLDNKSEKAGSNTGLTGKNDLILSTGGENGTYYAYGKILADYVSGKTDVSITAVPSNGSAANIQSMSKNLAQLGFCQSDVMTYAYNGERLFEGAKVSDFSAVAALYREHVQIVTTNSNIRTVSDLRGMSVAIGEYGTGTYYTAVDILNAYGLSENDIFASYQSFSDSAESLKSGRIDAAFIVASAPAAALTAFSTGTEVNLVNIDSEHINVLRSVCPYYSACSIPAGIYTGLDEDVQTVAVSAMLLARNDVSEDAVYAILKAIFADTAAITKEYAKGAELDLSFASSITCVPFHNGAVKFFSENGIQLSSKTDTSEKNIKVGLVCDVGGINDRGYNQSAWEGLQALAAEDSGIQVKYLESSSDADYLSNIYTFIDEGYDLIISAGFFLADATRVAAYDYPNQKFAIIDDDSNADLPNVACLMFAQEQVAYLAGLVAGYMTESKTVGYVQGMVYPSMNKYGVGFISGVLAACPDATVLQYNADNFGDSAAGAVVAKDMISHWADVLFHAAGGTGLGVIQACADEGVWAIGVDTDQSFMSPDRVLTSVIKRVDVACRDISKSVRSGSFTGGVHLYDLTNDGVGLAPDTSHIPQWVLEKVDQACNDIRSGKVVVPATAEEVPQFTLDD